LNKMGSLPLRILCAWVLLAYFPAGIMAETFTTNIVSGVYTDGGVLYYVGNTGPFNALLVTNQGWLQNVTGIIGNEPASTTNRVWIGGANSLWENTGNLYVGNSGAENELRVVAGGRLKAALVVLGSSSRATNNRILARGAGTQLEIGGGIRVGENSSGNELKLEDASRIVVGALNAVGYGGKASNNSAQLRGTGTYWFGGDLKIGAFGASSNQFTISEGAQVYTGFGYVGNGTANLALIAGAGSLWNNNWPLFVGDEGNGNLLVLTNQGRVNCAGAVVSGTRNVAIITGTGSIWDTGGSTGQLLIGSGEENEVRISNGGLVNSWAGRLIGQRNRVVILDPGSYWNNVDIVKVGDELEIGNQIIISNGGAMTSSVAIMSGDYGLWTVSGNGSEARIAGSVNIGYEIGLGNRVQIVDGGRMFNTDVYLAGTDLSFDPHRNNENSAIVRGPDSMWICANVIVGSTGSGNYIDVTEGARMSSSGHVYLGYFGSSGDNSVRIDGSGTIWNSQGQLSIGRDGSRNRVTVTNGAELLCADAFIGRGVNDLNGISIDGSNTTFRVTGNLQMGNGGFGNYMVISRGGRVITSSASIDSLNPSGRSNTVWITGSQSLWSNTGSLYVGVRSSLNYLRIADQATLSTDSITVGNNGVSYENLLTVSNATLIATNLGHSGSLSVQKGSIVIDGGEVQTDRLNATAGIGSELRLIRGNLTAESMMVSNGRRFYVGEGGAIASLRLGPGLHSFADGLAVGPQGALQVDGVISGDLASAGTLLFGNVFGRCVLRGSMTMDENSVTEFDIGGASGGTLYDFIQVSNAVAFAGELRIRLANAFIPASNSVFTLMRFASVIGSFDNVPSGSRITLEGSGVSCIVEYSGSSALKLFDFHNARPAISEIDPTWAIQYFGHSPLSEEEQQADVDEDGLSNLDEYRAGTDPRNGDSVLKISQILVSPTGSRLRFPCIQGKNYAILFSRDLVSWTTIQEPTLANRESGVCEWLDDGTQTAPLQITPRFYRILLK